MKKRKIFEMVCMAILLALVVVLQTISTFIKVGPFAFTLALTPIIVGAMIFGPKNGLILGLGFGIITFIFAATGADVGGNQLFIANPFFTLLVCILKACLAGYVGSIVFRLLKNKNLIAAVLITSIVVPVVNTGIFCISMPLLFKSTLVSWANGSNLLYYTFIGLIGINFLVELALNCVLSPAVYRVLKIFDEKYDNTIILEESE